MSRSAAVRLASWSFASLLMIFTISVIAPSMANAASEGGPLHGGLDVEFSGDGYLTGPDDTSFVDVAMRGDRPVVCGNDGDEGLIRRYKPNGDPDPTFSGDGELIFDPATLVSLTECLVMKDGRIVVVGDFAEAPGRGDGPTTALVGVVQRTGGSTGGSPKTAGGHSSCPTWATPHCPASPSIPVASWSSWAVPRRVRWSGSWQPG